MNASIRAWALGTVLLASAAAQDRGGEVPGLLVTLKSEKAPERAGSARGRSARSVPPRRTRCPIWARP
jgi:hypothetical protein